LASAKKCKRVCKSLKIQGLVFGNPVTGPLRLRELAITGSGTGLGEERAWAREIIRDDSMDSLESQLVLKAKWESWRDRSA
jgi:hypothetical protein